MSGEINYKQKYLDLKSKFMESVDMAFRLGFEQGGQQAQQDQMMQQQQQQAELEAAQAAGMGGQPGAPGGDPAAAGPEAGDFADQQDPGATQPAGPGQGIQPMKESEHPNGSELDQHIATLEGMLSKGDGVDAESLAKTIGEMKSLQKSLRFQAELRKSAQAIPAIAKAMHKPKFKFGVQASHNLNSTAKSAVTMQHKIVEGIMEKWEQEQKNASKDILSQLSIEGLTKKE